MIILLNPNACEGKAEKRWRHIEPELRDRLHSFDLYRFDGFERCREYFVSRLSEGEREFIAAGGDGTVNMLLNILLSSASTDCIRTVKLGAIGLGSSNDFHKPFEFYEQVSGLPCRIDFHSAFAHDVGVVTFNNISGNLKRLYWIINSSVGITAEANRLFNNPNAILKFLKYKSTCLAIIYAALRTLAVYRAIDITIDYKGQERRRITMENLGVVKNPHFSGSFCYDSPIEPCSGSFYIHLMEKKSMSGKLLALWRLTRPQAPQPMIQRWAADNLCLSAISPMAIEYDGEVVTADSVTYSLIKGAIQVCK